VFVSSGFRTAFGQDEVQGEEGDEDVSSVSDEGLGEAPPEPEEPSENLQPAVGEQEVKGYLQADPNVQGRNEVLDSAEAGDGDVAEEDVDVESVPKEPETEQSPDNTRSGNLDILYGKQSLYTVAGKSCECCSCNFSVRAKNWGWWGEKIWGIFPDSANKASFV